MHPFSTRPFRRSVSSLAAAGALLAPVAHAQSAAPTAPTDPRALAKYDKNNNGRLDPDELAAKQADDAKVASGVATASTSSAAAGREEVIEFSPFEVNAGDDKGYAAFSTLAGTRLNSRLEDIAGSISVVTKQQLIDPAALDNNDIFLYEIGTEGTGQFTDLTNDNRGEGVWDNVAGNPTGANRMRGLSSANIAVGGFTSSSTIPIDTYNVDAVEIARGPNSTLAGLADAGGTVNLVTNRGNVTRETSRFEARVDSYGGFRTSMDLNRPLIRNKLGLRISAVYNETGYVRKPSVDRTNRQQYALTFRPFRTTSFNASLEHFHQFAQRANSLTPRDSVTLWKSRGSPTWDPITQTGTVKGVRLAGTAIPAGLAGGFGATRILQFIDGGKIQLITKAANVNNPALGPTTAQQMVSISGELAAGPLYKIAGTTNKAIYDWEEIILSGTRINTKLEDLGASITVDTKQQMQDFAMLDINDVFLYEANTEGTGTYTDLFIDRNGVAQDNVARDPNNANRVRGIGPANQAFGNFQTGGPIDPAMIDGLEISRGPNSNIWGSGSGTVNAIPSAANLRRESSRLEFRTDSLGGFRTVLDLNRPLIPRKLALRSMIIFQEDQYVRQPSFSRINRYNGMITYKPFKNTTLRGAFEHYENYARRPNAILPRDGLSYWQDSGRPTWDASTWTLTRQGVRTVVPYSTTVATENALFGNGVASAGTELARAIIFVDRGAVDYWTTGYISGINATGIASPDFHPNNGHQRFIETAPPPRVGPLAPTSVSITNRAVYDWSEVNISAANWSHDKTDSYQAQLEHFFVNNSRHLLAAQFGFRREESRRQSRSLIGTSGESPMLVYMDVTERLPDGRANPCFLRPYVDALEPSSSRSSPMRDEYKSQLTATFSL